jgi:hypothetical protein
VTGTAGCVADSAASERSACHAGFADRFRAGGRTARFRAVAAAIGTASGRTAAAHTALPARRRA